MGRFTLEFFVVKHHSHVYFLTDITFFIGGQIL